MATQRKPIQTAAVEIGAIALHPELPRTTLAKSDVAPLAETAKRAGILNLPLAHEVERDGKTHPLLSGARRLAAAKLLGWKSIDICSTSANWTYPVAASCCAIVTVRKS